MTNAELLALLRESRKWLHPDEEDTHELSDRIDAALAENDAVPPSEVERAAFRRGVAAMREAAAHTVEAKVSNPYINRRMAEEIRALPDPEDTE